MTESQIYELLRQLDGIREALQTLAEIAKQELNEDE